MRFALNLVITTLLLIGLNAFNGLTLMHDGKPVLFTSLTWPIFGSILLVAVVIWLAGIVVGLLYGLSVMFTLGLMLLAYPFIGWFVLKATEHFMPGSLTLHGFWISLLCGWLLLIVKIPELRKRTD